MSLKFELAGIELPDMFWVDEKMVYEVAGSVDRTLGGTEIVWEHTLIGGRPITLTTKLGEWRLSTFTEDQLDEILELARVPNTTYSLTHDGSTYRVRFAHEDPPCVETNRIYPSGLYDVIIKLREVKQL